MTSEDILEIIIKQNLISIYLYTPSLIQPPNSSHFISYFSSPLLNPSPPPLFHSLQIIFTPQTQLPFFLTKTHKIKYNFNLTRIHLLSLLQMYKIAQENLLGLKIRNYTFVKVIGEGNYARVYQAFNQQTSQSVAAKVFPKELFKRNAKLYELVKTEIRVLKECNNQNVVKFVDSFMSEKSLLIFMELCNGGQLQQYLDQKGRLTEDQAIAFLKQIINGFKGLHQAKAMHRDFKASNVLLHQNICKIADLGFAKQVDEDQTTRTLLGSGLTMAPEVHQQKSYGRKADIWSVAVVFYQLIYGDYPYKGHTDHQILKNIVTSRPKYDMFDISEKAKDFIERCLVVDPKKRISWKEIYSHPIIVQEENIKYNVGRSSIRLQQNKIFYDRESYPEEKIEKQKQQQQIKEEKLEITDKNVQKLVLESEQRIKIELAIKDFQNYYFNRRNSIMFIFKHIISNITAIQKKVRANHSITLFIISKKAYLDIKAFSLCLTSNKNILPFDSYFEEFTQSKQYKDIIELIQSDISLIRLQLKQYCFILPQTLNEEIRNQLDLQHASNPSWEQLVMDILNSYENELVGNLDDVPQSQKKTVVKLIVALQYYKTVKQDRQIQQFDKQIEGLCYSKKEIELKQEWFSKLTGYQ